LQNPVVKCRENKGLSRSKFAVLLAVDYWRLAACERGLPAEVPPAILTGLSELGADSQGIAAEYRAWRDLERNELAVATTAAPGGAV